MRILLVEDDALLRRLVVETLAPALFQTDTASNLAQAGIAVDQHAYSGVILGRRLPDGNGLSLLRRWRDAGNAIPCLLLSNGSVADHTEGMEAGADDCLTRSFAPGELLARLRSVLRRPMKYPAPGLHAVGDLVVDLEATTVTLAGRQLALTKREFHLLRLLAEARGRPLTRQRLFNQLYGPGSAVGKGSLDVALHRLRRKLRAAEVPRRGRQPATCRLSPALRRRCLGADAIAAASAIRLQRPVMQVQA